MERFLPLVEMVASRLRSEFPRIERGELAGYGRLALVEALPRYREDGCSLPAYLMCRVRFRIIDQLRLDGLADRPYRRTAPVVQSLETMKASGWDVTDRRATDPEMAARQSEIRARVDGAISKLPRRWQAVVRLYYYEGLTEREIGERAGVSYGRVGQLLRAARDRLRRALWDMKGR